jgi:cell division protease FtsH
MLTDGADPVRKISIILSGMALGVTFAAPDADRFSYERRELLAKIKVALGGRAAEEIVYGEPTTGAESDIEQLTELARQMVGRWGMSDEIGPLALLPSESRGPLLPGASAVSARTQERIDEEVARIVAAAHKEVLALLAEHRAKLDALAAALLEHETLDEDDAYAAAGVEHHSARSDPPAPAPGLGEPIGSA